MINLIPPIARKKVAREYWLRVSAVACFAVGTVSLIAGVLLLPTYVLIQLQIDVQKSSADTLTDTASSYDVSAAQLINASRQAQLLVERSQSAVVSSYVQTIETIAGPDIAVIDTEYTKGDVTDALSVSGQATTRQALVSFRDQLEANPQFEAVDLPISNLIKDRDILFTITMLGTPESYE